MIITQNITYYHILSWVVLYIVMSALFPIATKEQSYTTLHYTNWQHFEALKAAGINLYPVTILLISQYLEMWNASAGKQRA